MHDRATMMGAPQWLAHWAGLTPDAPALIIEGQAPIRYGEWAVAVAQMARYLREAGIGPGMLVGIETANQYLHAVTILGAETLGAGTASFSPFEIASGDHVVGRCDWLLHETAANTLSQALRKRRLDEAFTTAVIQIVLTGDDIRALQSPPAADTLRRVINSSGTTGARKSVGYTTAILTSILQSEATILPDSGRDCAIIIFYDFVSTAGYRYMLRALHDGRPLYMIGLGSFGHIVETMASFHVVAVQGQLPDIINAYSQRFDLAPRRSIHVIGATIPAATWAHLTPSRFGYASNGYAPSEALRVAYSSLGAPYTLYDDAEVRIVDDRGVEVAAGDSGLIELRNPRMVSGYLWDPDLTKRHFVDGWFRTFDIGRMPTARTLIVSGRADDMLNIGGIKIMPGPLEERLRRLAGVSEAVVVAIPDRNTISRMHVIIEGERESLDTAFAAAVRDTIGAAGFDFFLHCLTEFPRTETGKIQRNALKDRFANV